MPDTVVKPRTNCDGERRGGIGHRERVDPRQRYGLGPPIYVA